MRASFGQIGTTAGLFLGGILGAALGVQRLFLVAGLGGIVVSSLIYVPYAIRGRSRTAAEAAAEQASTADVAYLDGEN